MKLNEELDFYSDEEKDNMELTQEELDDCADLYGELQSLEELPPSLTNAAVTKRKNFLFDKMLKTGTAVKLPNAPWKCQQCGFLNSRDSLECLICHTQYEEE